MAMRAGDLVGAAEREAWNLALRLQEEALSRPGAGMMVVGAGQLSAWPQLAGASLRALDAIPMTQPQREAHRTLGNVLGHIAGLKGWRVVGTAPPDPQLVHMATLLGATADMLSPRPGAPVPDAADALGFRDRIAACVSTAARFTLATNQDVSPRLSRTSLFQALSQVSVEAQRMAVTGPLGRASILEDVAVPSPARDTTSVLTAWLSRATDTLTPWVAAGSARAVQAVAVDLGVVMRAAALTVHAAGRGGALPMEGANAAERSLSRSAAGWVDAARAWVPQVAAGGVRSPEQIAASRQLHDFVQGQWRDESRWVSPGELRSRMDVTQGCRDFAHLMPALVDVGSQYAEVVQTLARSQALMTPARALPREVRSAEHLEALSKGRWVALPSSSPTALQLGDSASAAVTSMGPAQRDLSAAVKDLLTQSRERGIGR